MPLIASLIAAALVCSGCVSTRQYTNPSSGCTFTTTSYQTGIWDQSTLDITCPEDKQ